MSPHSTPQPAIRITPSMIDAACEAMDRNGLFRCDCSIGLPDPIAAFAAVRDALTAGGYAVQIDRSVVQGDERISRNRAPAPV